MQFTDIFIRRPVLASVVSLLILVLGLRAYAVLPILQFPRTENALVTVTTIYYGADPDVVAGFITTPLENAIAQANGIDYMNSVSQSSVSTITVTLRLNYDADKALTEINTKVASVLNQLPPGTLQPTLDGEDRPDHRRHVYRLQQRHLGAEPDHRLLDARGAAKTASGAGRADRGTARPEGVCAARLARSAKARRLRAHRDRRQPGAHRQRLHIRHRQYQRPDGAGQSVRLDQPAFGGRVPQSGDQAKRRRHRAAQGRRQCHARRRGLRVRGRLRRQAGGLYRHPGGAVGQSARGDRRHPQGVPGNPGAAAARAQRRDHLRFHRIRAQRHQRGDPQPGRGADHRDLGGVPLPGFDARLDHPDGRHSAVADRHAHYSSGARLFDQPVDAVGAGAGHRPRGRRRHHRGRERQPPSRGRHGADGRRHPGGARARRPDHRHDRGAGRGLRADRLPERTDRRAVRRVRLRAGRRRHHIGHRGADLVADAVLAAAQGARSRARRLGGAADAVHRPAVSPAARRLTNAGCTAA